MDALNVTATESAVSKISSATNNITEALGDLGSTRVGRLDNAFVGSEINNEGALNYYDVIGINGNGVGKMLTKMEDYINAIETHISGFKDVESRTGAYVGEYAEGVKSYIDSVAELCKNYVSSLRYFEQQLQEIAAAYKSADEQMQTNLVTYGSKIVSGGGTYQAASNQSSTSGNGAIVK